MDLPQRQQQFIGILDRNMREIYEGDVVKFSTLNGEELGEVLYSTDSCAYYINDYLIMNLSLASLEVVGNMVEDYMWDESGEKLVKQYEDTDSKVKYYQRMKTPNKNEKITMYEAFLHKINSFIISCNHEGVRELVENADNWSYAHRVGNGELSDRKQQQIINNAFWKLLETPNADKETKARQEAWEKMLKEKHKAFMKNI